MSKSQLNILQTVVLPDSRTTQRFCVHDFLCPGVRPDGRSDAPAENEDMVKPHG
jgi:hypothetical protein